MDELQTIKELASDIASAVSGIFPDVEVVIIGEDEMIVGKSDNYLPAKHTPAYTPYIRGLLQRKKYSVIKDPGINSLCKGCANAGHCPQKLEIAVPFTIENTWSGYLSMVAFSEDAKKRLLKRESNVVKFLQTLLDVMVKTGKCHVAQFEAYSITKKLDMLLRHLDAVVFSLNREGLVLSYNQPFQELFNSKGSKKHFNLLKRLEKKNIIAQSIHENEGFNDRECALVIDGKLHRIVLSYKHIRKEENSEYAEDEHIFIMRSLEDARRLMFQTERTVSNEIDTIIGNSDDTQKLRETIRNFSNTSSTVLVRGETGTGKELVASSLHALSNRSINPFVTINCAAIPDSLLESELFGYEQGTFTGASKSGKPGLFELGNGGTIFLDEIGDMPLHLQSKLLRVLQDRQVVRLGGFHPTNLDIRIIAATNQNLEQLVKDKKFRSDLFYRLNVLPIHISPLRNRMDDFNDLLFFFIEKYNNKLGKYITGINQKLLTILKSYTWPGNIRELENVIEYTINLAQNPILTEEVCPPEIMAAVGGTPARALTLKEMLQQEEIRIIKEAIAKYGNEKSAIEKAAGLLGVSRASLYGKVKNYNLYP